MNSNNYNTDSSELSLDDIVTEYDRKNSSVNVSEIYDDVIGGGVKMWMATLGKKAKNAKKEFANRIKKILKGKNAMEIQRKLQKEKEMLFQRCEEAGIANPTIANCTENEIRQKKLQALRDEQCKNKNILDTQGKLLQGEGSCTEFVIHRNKVQSIFDDECAQLYNNGEGMVNNENKLAKGPADCNKFTIAQYKAQQKKDQECAAMNMKDKTGAIAKGSDDCNDITIKHNRKMAKKGASNKQLLDRCVELGIYTNEEAAKIKYDRDFEVRCNKQTIKAATKSSKNADNCKEIFMPDGKQAKGDVYCSPKAVKAFKTYKKKVNNLEKKRTKDCGKLKLNIDANNLLGLSTPTKRNCDDYEISSEKIKRKLEKKQKKLDAKCKKVKMGTGPELCNDNTYPIGKAQDKLNKKCIKLKLGTGAKSCNPATIKEAKKFSKLLKKCKKLEPYTGQTSETCTEELINFAKKQAKLDKKCKKLGIDETKCTKEAIEDNKAKKKAWKKCKKINKYLVKQGKKEITEKDCVPLQMNIMQAEIDYDKKWYKDNKKECKRLFVDGQCKKGALSGMEALKDARAKELSERQKASQIAQLGSKANQRQTVRAAKKYNWLTQLTESDSNSYGLTDVEDKISTLENILEKLN